MNKECELVRDRQERFNMVRCWFVVAWRLVDPITKKEIRCSLGLRQRQRLESLQKRKGGALFRRKNENPRPDTTGN